MLVGEIMKKIIVLLVLIVSLSGCKIDQTELDEIEFNDVVYSFEEVSSDGYDMFVGDAHLIEILYSEEVFIISTEIDGDIFIISGDLTQYTISKNGSIILIDGIELSPTGSEFVEWNEDIIPIMEKYVD